MGKFIGDDTMTTEFDSRKVQVWSHGICHMANMAFSEAHTVLISLNGLISRELFLIVHGYFFLCLWC